MTEEEIAQLLTDLEELLAELGLDFIVTQERVLAVEGVSQQPTDVDDANDRELDDLTPRIPISSAAPEAPGLWEISPPSNRKPRFRKSDVVVTPLDARARLAILLDLVEVASAGTVAMERDVRARLREFERLAADRPTSASEAIINADWAEKWDGTVLFEDPPEAQLRGQVLPAWTLPTADVLTATASRARTVVSLLGELRAQAGLSRGAWLAPHAEDSGSDDPWSLMEGRNDERR